MNPQKGALPRKNGTLLFLTELLVAILVLAAAAALCVGLFAAARAQRGQSAALTRAVALAENAAEAFKAQGADEGVFYYDAAGMPCEGENAAYVLTLRAEHETGLSTAAIEVADAAGAPLYALSTAALNGGAP